MRACSALALIWVAVAIGGCGAVTDFAKYTFDDEDAAPAAQEDPDAGSSVPDDHEDAGPASPDGGDVTPSGDAGHDAQSPPVDGGQQDAGGEPARATTVVQTGGGAVIVTPDYRLSISVGAPQPMGDRATESHRLRLGPAGAQ